MKIMRKIKSLILPTVFRLDCRDEYGNPVSETILVDSLIIRFWFRVKYLFRKKKPLITSITVKNQ